jgi:hypothetical protein
MGILLFIFFAFLVIGFTIKTSKPADHRMKNYRDPQDGSIDTTTNFFSAQHISNHNSFDDYSDNCASDSCGDQGCSDSNCDCGGSDGGGCD